MGEQAGMNFDYAPQVAIVGDTVYFGSTTDDTLWALAAATGKTKWAFTTGGPIRFAPAIDDGLAYVASDDGFVYCIDAATGRLIWKFFGGLYDSRMIGNGRMMSRWPVRSGVVVVEGTVYFGAGMWASEGVYIFAVDAKTGEEIWCNDTSLEYRRGPHGSYAMTGVMPQGYCAAAKDKVVFNTGMSGCWGFDSRTGEALGRNYIGNEQMPRGNSAVLVMKEDGTYFHGGNLPSKSPEVIKYADVRQHWVRAGNTMIMCEERVVGAVAAGAHDETLWQHGFESTPAGLAVGNELLVVSTTDGAIHCFRHATRDTRHAPQAVGPGARTLTTAAPGPAASILKETRSQKISKGFVLVLGEQDATLAEAIAANSQLKVICALTDEATVDAERKRLRETTGLYGSGISVDHLATTKLPYPCCFANVIVANRIPSGLPVEEVRRVLRPCGGVLIRGGKYVDILLSKLPGALDWDSKVTMDQRVRWPLQMQWFGEPGPMHTGGKGHGGPIPANGIAIYTGRRNLTAVDAYNGTVLWRRDRADVAARPGGISVDADHVYVPVKKPVGTKMKYSTVVLDLRTGEPVESVSRQAGTNRSGPRRESRSEEDIAKYGPMRVHPLTGGQVSKSYVRSHGCAGIAGSAAMDFFRQGQACHIDDRRLVERRLAVGLQGDQGANCFRTRRSLENA